MKYRSLREAVIADDYAAASELLKKALEGGEALIEFVNDFLYLGARIEYDGPTDKHPILALNALKNIIADNRHQPSEILLRFALETIIGSPLRTGDSVVLEQLEKEGPGSVVFVRDLEQAVLSGDMGKSEREAARIHLVADNSAGVLELITQLTLREPVVFAGFMYHLLRAYAFRRRQEEAWAYTKCALNELRKFPLSETNIRGNQTPAKMLPRILAIDDVALWVTFAAVWRLWELDCVRQSGFRQAISTWLSSINVEDRSVGDGESAVNLLMEYRRQAGNQFIIAAEKICNDKHNHNRQNRLVALEAMRFFTKKANPADMPLIAANIYRVV
ncbi:MAG: hypothetical protein GXO92_03010 [FCB group bacterium]|nr:hypothetical protein [FCB group bacterium]